MREDYQAKLLVNDKPIEMNPFVEDLLSRVSVGIVSSLKGVESIKEVEIQKQADDIKIMVNGETINLITFPVMIIESTLVGLISVLKGVDNIKSFCITVKAIT